MKRVITANLGLMIISAFIFLTVPVFAPVQSTQAIVGPPPVGQTLVREGTFAIEVAKSFGLSGDVNEVEAESWLADKGISPANGWIADYPVTPDIIGELRNAAVDAAETNKISMDKAEAVKRVDRCLAALNLAITPLNDGKYATVIETDNEIVPATEVANYYIDEGPPAVTYYAPPPDYYGMYSWVSSPFWCDGFWFGGFFILNDFHRPVFIGRDHHRGFVSNHFRDGDHGRFSRIDPQTRASGSTATGIGMSGGRISAPIGTWNNIRSETNPPHAYAPSAIRSVTASTNSTPSPSHAPPVMRTTSAVTDHQVAMRGGERTITPASGGYGSRGGSYISVRSNTPHLSTVGEPYRTVAAPVRRAGMSVFTPPRSTNHSVSFHSGFTGGSPSRGYAGSFSFSGHTRR